MIDTLWQDLKYAARSLRRTPGFAIAAIVTLALGIGANTAIFTLLDAVMFKPLNVPRHTISSRCTNSRAKVTRTPQAAPGDTRASRILASSDCARRSAIAVRSRR